MFGINKIKPASLQDFINALAKVSGENVVAYAAEEYGNGYFWIFSGINEGRSDSPIAYSA